LDDVGFVKEHTMAVAEVEKGYRSPVHKLLPFFERSRDGWKGKCKKARRAVKRLKNQTAKLQKSRQRWKELALRQRRDLKRLQRELEAQKL
jgi:hypothetical protein